ncbi:MAG TPA: hypothetical protein VES36_00920 [Candidatus Limnocylindrales bacterium]|nr:hypothetical protein [Candidatus Limnocylindrales bacterium]
MPAAPASCSRRVGHTATAAALVAVRGLALRRLTGLARARRAAVALAAVAVAAQQDLIAATRAQEQAGWTLHGHPGKAEGAGRTRPSAPHCCGTAFIGTV